MGKMKEKTLNSQKAMVTEEVVLCIESEAIRKMKLGMLSKMVDNVEILKALKKTPGLRIRFTKHNVDFSEDMTTDELIEDVFLTVSKKLHMKQTLVFVKGQVFKEET